MSENVEPSINKRVFHLSTPEELFMKFYWELGNLRKTMETQADNQQSWKLASYHAYNASVTVWHLSDWTWNSLSTLSQGQLASRLGFTIGKSSTENLKAFQQALRKRSRALEICWDIANGSKHLDTHKNSKIDAQMKVDIKHASFEEFKLGRPLETIYYDFMVRWNNQSLRIVQVFEEARDFWMQFLNSVDLFGDIFIDAQINVTITRNEQK